MAHARTWHFSRRLQQRRRQVSRRQQVEIIPDSLPHQTTEQEQLACGGCRGWQCVSVPRERRWRGIRRRRDTRFGNGDWRWELQPALRPWVCRALLLLLLLLLKLLGLGLGLARGTLCRRLLCWLRGSYGAAIERVNVHATIPSLALALHLRGHAIHGDIGATSSVEAAARLYQERVGFPTRRHGVQCERMQGRKMI